MISICIELHTINDTIGTMDNSLTKWMKLFYNNCLCISQSSLTWYSLLWISLANYGIPAIISATVTFVMTRDISNIMVIERLVLY